MPFITFIYKVDNYHKTYYAKYCSNTPYTNEYELYGEAKHILVAALDAYKNGKSNIKITGDVLTFSKIDTSPNSREITCFDFYHDYENNIYINGTFYGKPMTPLFLRKP